MKKEQSKEKIDKFNAVYSKAVERTKNVNELCKIFFDNYHSDNINMHHFLRDSVHLNIYHYINDKNCDSLIDYFSNDNLTQVKGIAEYQVNDETYIDAIDV